MKMGRSEQVLRYVLLSCGVLMVLLPLYMTLITAFKTTAENTASFFAPPRSFYLGNFKGVLQKGGYLRAFFNTVYITAGVIVGNLILMPALSYAISRSMHLYVHDPHCGLLCYYAETHYWGPYQRGNKKLK